jgi:hypothetical protein
MIAVLLLVNATVLGQLPPVIDDDPLAREIYNKSYSKKQYDRYAGQIVKAGEMIRYGQGAVILPDSNNFLNAIFTKGILYPELVHGIRFDLLNISDVTEIRSPHNNKQYKWFTFWLYRPGMANPTSYYFELENKQATEQTDMRTFIEGSRLTFFSFGTIIL